MCYVLVIYASLIAWDCQCICDVGGFEAVLPSLLDHTHRSEVP